MADKVRAEADAEGYRRGIEAAAKIAEEHKGRCSENPCALPKIIADRIRALKTSPRSY